MGGWPRDSTFKIGFQLLSISKPEIIQTGILLVKNVNAFNYSPSIIIGFSCQAFYLIKEKLVTSGRPMIWDTIIIWFNICKVLFAWLLMFAYSDFKFSFCLADILIWWLLAWTWVHGMRGIPRISLWSSFEKNIAQDSSFLAMLNFFFRSYASW